MSLIHSENFENAEVVDLKHLNIAMPHNFNFSGACPDRPFMHPGTDGARYWIEEGFAHSGSRCIGMELHDITKARRCEFTLLNAQDIGDEIGFSVEVLLPADWNLYAPGSWSNRWYSICTPLASRKNLLGNYSPKIEMIIHDAVSQIPSHFDMVLRYHDYHGTHSTIGYTWNPDFPLPLGRWFNIRGWMRRHTTNGAIKAWVDGIQIANETGVKTIAEEEPDLGYNVCLAKIYYDCRDTTPHKIWFDDVKIYNRMPPTPEPPVSRRVLGTGAGAALGASLGYAVGGTPGAAIGTGLGSALGYVISGRLPSTSATVCAKCGREFMLTTHGIPVWCPHCGEEQIVEKEGVK